MHYLGIPLSRAFEMQNSAYQYVAQRGTFDATDAYTGVDWLSEQLFQR